MKYAAASLRLVTFSTLFSASVMAAPTVVPDAPSIAAKGYILMDFHSGTILAQQNADESLNPASLTKLMTSYVIGQEVKRGNISLEDNVVISQNAWARNFPDSSKMFIEVGKTVKAEDLNRGIIIQSGNDASVAMAEHVAGSEDAFVSLMNSWASTLGMTSSHFSNVHGLDAENLYTTPRDIAVLAQAIIRDVPAQHQYYSEKSFTYNGITQNNRNGLLWDRSLNVDGMKTGYTQSAGYNLVSTATQGQMRLISVVMGTSSARSREAESKKLLNYGFRFFETVSPHKAGQEVVSERIWMGDAEQISLGVPSDTFVTVMRSQRNNLVANAELSGELEAPIRKGDQVGRLVYQLDNEVITEVPLVALEDVERGGFFSRIKDMFIRFLKGLFS
ncbi:D-alanyl-D-alanine carboxypeptidase family protein [Thaumasiovibrio subtropicus]|uniref:D-alanyl-D-alanine carboxypeptidase family protein n=1 Tax=Thaumasiovibrio subtropicus TaxID=1891207 RepID=UPI000B355CBD|nr:D-alanyl-D-alanine carboxypeptidase family protein [Thaumasiovibrio subtropicus]